MFDVCLPLRVSMPRYGGVFRYALRAARCRDNITCYYAREAMLALRLR